ncbi:MAG: hypothetical protein GEV11_13720 [Streptosporangiales bacterium]|nr:hypothetical protein [Streptosporangiales bacterium]
MNPPRPAVPFSAVALVVTALLAAACSGSGGAATAPDEPPLGTVTTPSSADEVELPLDPYLGVDVRDEVDTAIDRVVRDCMRKHGQRWSAVDYRGRIDELSATDPYLFVSEEQARERGYRPDHDPIAKRMERAAPGRELDEAGEAVYVGGPGAPKGVPEGGCSAEGQRSVGAPPAGDTTLPETLANRAREQAETDSRVEAAVRAWSACMRQAGYRYRGPENAAADPRWAGGGAAGPQETKAARADVTCKATSRLTGTWVAAQNAYQRKQIERNRTALAPILTWWREQERNAERILEKD